MSVKQVASPVLPGRERAHPPVGKGCGQGSSRLGPGLPFYNLTSNRSVEKGMIEDEMAGWHHGYDVREFE